MASPNTSPFDLTPPVRPNKDHFNGVAKEDDEEEPPNPREQPNAAEWNTMEWLLLSIGRVMPLLIFSCANGGITKMGAAPSALQIVALTYTSPSTGVYEITWASGTFPASQAEPAAFLNEGPGQISAEAITNGVRVRTYDETGAPTNKKFTVSVY